MSEIILETNSNKDASIIIQKPRIFEWLILNFLNYQIYYEIGNRISNKIYRWIEK